MFLPRRLVSLVAAAGFVVGGVVLSRGEQQDDGPASAGALKDGFETPQPSWEREYTDTTVRLSAHDRSDRAAHQGQLAEHFQFDAGIGGQFFVSYALPKVPVTADLGVTLFVRSNKQGAQLFGKVILPADIDPETKAPSYVLLPGTVFGRVDRWEKLELRDMPPAIEEQARVPQGIDPASGAAGGGLSRARGREHHGRCRRDGGVPRRPQRGPRAPADRGGLGEGRRRRQGPGLQTPGPGRPGE